MSAVRCSPHSVVLSLSSRQGYATLELLLLDASSFPFHYVARTMNRDEVLPILRPSFHWLQWTSRGAWGTLPYHVGVVPVSTISMFLPVCASAPASSRRPRANPSSRSHFFHRMPAASYLCATCTHILAKCYVRRRAPAPFLAASVQIGARTARKIRVVPPHTLR